MQPKSASYLPRNRRIVQVRASPRALQEALGGQRQQQKLQQPPCLSHGVCMGLPPLLLERWTPARMRGWQRKGDNSEETDGTESNKPRAIGHRCVAKEKGDGQAWWRTDGESKRRLGGSTQCAIEY
jgi:hypothetical protein